MAPSTPGIKDAVDAVELMDIGFDKLREHLRPTYRAHRAITAGGIQPNIIPDYAQIWWFVRDANMAAAKETFDKLVKIAEGATLMTGTTYEYQIDAAGWPQLGLKSIAEALQTNIDAVGMPQWSDDEQAFARKFQTAIRHEFGAIELKDQLTALDQLLARYPQLDKERIAIWGWSNGGSMMCCTSSHQMGSLTRPPGNAGRWSGWLPGQPVRGYCGDGAY